MNRIFLLLITLMLAWTTGNLLRETQSWWIAGMSGMLMVVFGLQFIVSLGKDNDDE